MSRLPQIFRLGVQLIRHPHWPQVRLLSAKKVLRKPVISAIASTQHNEQPKTEWKDTIETLETLLEIRKFAASELVFKCKSLWDASISVVKKNHSLLRKSGISNETLADYPELLVEKTSVQSKLDAIKELPFDVNEVAPLLLIPSKSFHSFVKRNPKERILAVSKILKVTVQEACGFLSTKSFLRTIELDKLETNVETLLGFNISIEDIHADLWVLRYSDQQISSRLTEARDHNIENVKTWMVRAQSEIFYNYIRRRSDNKLILGNSSLAEYLSERLECSIEMANYIIHKQPVLKNKSLKKIKDHIDYLFASGFKPYHICRVPKILVHSVETTKKRLAQMEEKGLSLDSVYMLTKSQKEFMQFYQALLKSKNKSNKSIDK